MELWRGGGSSVSFTYLSQQIVSAPGIAIWADNFTLNLPESCKSQRNQTDQNKSSDQGLKMG
jgi:hypothetical protein